MLMANDTIAMLIEPLITKGSILRGGTLGDGNLNKLDSVILIF